MLAIEIDNLTKRFNDKTAVNSLSMHVEEGAIYGFIGDNGSGKSTTQKMICGLLNQTEGTIKLFGKSHQDITMRRKIGLLIESPALFPYVSAYENMKLQALNLGIKNPKKRIESCLYKVGLKDVGKKKVKNFSLGMKQRLAIAISLLGNPSLLILDEPINGLDPNGIIEIRNTLLELNTKYNITILISSHILGELSKIATHYGIIKDGQIVEEISAQELSKRCEDYMIIKSSEIDQVKEVLDQKLTADEIVKSDVNEIKVYGTMDGKRVNTLLVEKGYIIEELSFQRMDLEGYFLKKMGGLAYE